MIFPLLIGVTAAVTVLAVIFTLLYRTHRKTDSSYAALAIVFWVAAAFSGVVLALYCDEYNDLSLSDILSFYGTIASVLASAYLGYVVYKIEKGEVQRGNSCCCIMNKISATDREPGDEEIMEIRWVTNDFTEEYPAPAEQAPQELVIPDALKCTMVIIGRGYAKMEVDLLLQKMKERMKAHPAEKQPPVMLFSVENHGPAFLQNVRFDFSSKVKFGTALVMSSTPDHKCKWLFLPGQVRNGQRVLVTFTSCYGNKTYADMKLVDLFPDTYPGMFYSCKHYHYHGARKPAE